MGKLMLSARPSYNGSRLRSPKPTVCSAPSPIHNLPSFLRSPDQPRSTCDPHTPPAPRLLDRPSDHPSDPRPGRSSAPRRPYPFRRPLNWPGHSEVATAISGGISQIPCSGRVARHVRDCIVPPPASTHRTRPAPLRTEHRRRRANDVRRRDQHYDVPTSRCPFPPWRQPTPTRQTPPQP